MSPYAPRPRAQVGASIQSTLDALAEYLELVLDGFNAFANQHLWEPSGEDAPFEVERQRAMNNQIGPGGPWGEEMIQYARTAAVLHTSLASQYLEGLLTLLHDHEVMFPPTPIVRSIAENCGFVCWLLYPGERWSWSPPAADGGKMLAGWGERRRAARASLARIQDATRSKTAALLLQHPDAPKAGAVLKALRGSVLREMFYPSEICNDNGTIYLRGERFPGLQQLVETIEDLEQTGRVGLVNRTAAARYAVLSNGTHPTSSYLTEFVRWPSPAQTGQGRWQLDSATFTVRLYHMAITEFLIAWQLLAAYLGYDQREARDLALTFDQDPRFAAHRSDPSAKP